MDDPVANAILKQYFRRLEEALSGLPADRRQQILEDLRAHVTESLAAEPDHSDASLLAVLDRVGDPDEIAREAMADATEASEPGAFPSRPRRRLADLTRSRVGRLLALAIPVVAAAAVAILIVTDASPSAASDPSPSSRSAWLPASSVSGDHDSQGASDCGPQTVTGSESASALEADASEVASGAVDGHGWSLWSKHGQSGANGLETGGIVVDHVAHGLCPGFPNPGEMELLDPSGGGRGLAYGVVGYPGSAKVEIYRGTVESFARGGLLTTTTAQVVNGVAFFIAALPASACSYRAVELETTSRSDSSEHNLGFSTSHCSAGQLVPINWSQGIWGLSPGRFQPGPGGGGISNAPVTRDGWLPASDVSGDHNSPGASDCSPQTVTGSEPAASLEASASKVASGQVDGHSWSLWSKRGQSGANGLETGGIVVDGTAHGLCPAFPNPGEMELLDPSGGGNGLAYGVVGYPGSAKVDIYRGTVESFARGGLLTTATAQVVNGVAFFITALPGPACSYRSLELNTTSRSDSTEHNLGFSTSRCSAGQLVPINWSQGIWGLSPGRFQTGPGD